MSKSTSVERPYYHYDPLTGTTSDAIMKKGVAISAVDILPSELPRESSKHFGEALLPLLSSVLDPSSSAIAPELAAATVAQNGALEENFRYIDQLKNEVLVGAKNWVNQKSPKRSDSEKEGRFVDGKSLMLVLDGHLFDSGLLNDVLDIFEAHNCGVEIADIVVGGKALGSTENRPSHAVLRAFCLNPNGPAAALREAAAKAESLAPLLPKAEATCSVIAPSQDDDEQPAPSESTSDTPSASASPYNVQKDWSGKKNVLLLGSGRVASSFSEYTGRSNDTVVVVAGMVESEVLSVCSEASHSEPHVFDVAAETERDRLRSLVERADVVVSLLPAPLHSMVGELCIASGTDMVTASYVSPAVASLAGRAETAGITILNEIGLDPGMDHMSAMRIIDGVKDRGGRVTEFSSVCGGLPAPEAAGNPLMYKFSWSPMGVLTASQNSATFLKDGQVVEIAGPELLNSASDVLSFPAMNLECLPNRDSLAYRTVYGIEDADTVFRGTLRFKGFGEVMYGAKKLGLLEDAEEGEGGGETWTEVVENLLAENGVESVEEFYEVKCGGSGGGGGRKLEGLLTWLGMLDKENPLPLSDRSSRLKSLCSLLEGRLAYEEGERDMVLMAHTVVAEFPDGTVEEHTSTMQLYGDERFTAMAKTVGVTAAVGCEMVLSGHVQEKGVLTPVSKNIYGRALEMLEREGLVFEETCVVRRKKERK